MTASRHATHETRPAGRLDPRARARRGAALMMALIALVVIGALGTALGMAVMRQVSSARRRSARDELLNAAESGVDLALDALARDPSWRGAGRLPPGRGVAVPGGECRMSVEPGGNGGYVVTSRVARHGRELGVRAAVRATGDGRFRIASWDELP